MSQESFVKDLSFRIHHMMLPVTDLDRSLDFYTHLLGMTVKERHANPTRRVDVGLVGYGEASEGPFLELIQDLSRGSTAHMDPLNVHVAIDVNDLQALCGILEKEGIVFIRPFKQRGDGKGFSAWIRDPDGHELELAERHAAVEARLGT